MLQVSAKAHEVLTSKVKIKPKFLSFHESLGDDSFTTLSSNECFSTSPNEESSKKHVFWDIKHKNFAKRLVARENGLLQMIAKGKIFIATKLNVYKNAK